MRSERAWVLFQAGLVEPCHFNEAEGVGEEAVGLEEICHHQDDNASSTSSLW